MQTLAYVIFAAFNAHRGLQIQPLILSTLDEHFLTVILPYVQMVNYKIRKFLDKKWLGFDKTR